MNAEPMYYPNKEETEIIMLEDRRIIWTVLGIKHWEPVFKRYGKKLCDIKPSPSSKQLRAVDVKLNGISQSLNCSKKLSKSRIPMPHWSDDFCLQSLLETIKKNYGLS